ncbi:MAG: Holliday junction branch migration protein RuvA [Flavobacteriales bacterium]|nr:MAG: Holliday junction branch migration protein RuvA [Flavobacteriales bacterium]CAI8310906.1 MAG: Holliday junction ATP-dependent DNA helicase RuvA [Flavobacteriales bacterium]|tara:strand:+ start:1609 stop:2190 length:582 start_codon:yes stop_codon:yes gene_type:complete
MITYIKGRLIEKTPTKIIVESYGIGYEINISLNTYEKIPDEENIKIYTYLQRKEDSDILFGFSSENERSIFQQLISISGIGPSTARTILSSISPAEIQEAVFSEDVNRIKSIKGIGLKTAQRLIIELKDKVELFDKKDIDLSGKNLNIKNEALLALSALGFNKSKSENIVSKLYFENKDIELQELIKKSLNKL